MYVQLSAFEQTYKFLYKPKSTLIFIIHYVLV